MSNYWASFWLGVEAVLLIAGLAAMALVIFLVVLALDRFLSGGR